MYSCTMYNRKAKGREKQDRKSLSSHQGKQFFENRIIRVEITKAIKPQSAQRCVEMRLKRAAKRKNS